jgi:hypothetical protein
MNSSVRISRDIVPLIPYFESFTINVLSCIVYCKRRVFFLTIKVLLQNLLLEYGYHNVKLVKVELYLIEIQRIAHFAFDNFSQLFDIYSVFFIYTKNIVKTK